MPHNDRLFSLDNKVWRKSKSAGTKLYKGKTGAIINYPPRFIQMPLLNPVGVQAYCATL